MADGVAVGNPDVPSISVETDSTEAVLRGLDEVLYSFTVTPHNPLGEGRASIARMDRSLSEVSGIAVPAADDAGSDSAEETPSTEPPAAPAATSPPASTQVSPGLPHRNHLGASNSAPTLMVSAHRTGHTPSMGKQKQPRTRPR